MKKPLATTDEEASKVVEKVVPSVQEPAQKPAQKPEPPKKAEVEKKSQSEPVTDRENDLVRTTMDLPRYIHTAIKIKSAQDQLSLKDYIVKLVKEDLNLK